MENDLERALNDACDRAVSVEGRIHREEIRMLFLAAALPTAKGEVLEIGSYKGRSTVVLAKGVLWAGEGRLVACDPFTGPSGDLTYRDFVAALECHRVAEVVEVQRKLSGELAASWERPIRLAWIDGDHSYEGVKTDVNGFFPHLSPGAVVAFHDVGRSRFPGCTRCFIEDVLLSDSFGMCGMDHYVAWSQFVGEGGIEEHRQAKAAAHKLISARLARQAFGTKLDPLTRWRYHRFRKSRSFERWITAASHT